MAGLTVSLTVLTKARLGGSRTDRLEPASRTNQLPRSNQILCVSFAVIFGRRDEDAEQRRPSKSAGRKHEMGILLEQPERVLERLGQF